MWPHMADSLKKQLDRAREELSFKASLASLAHIRLAEAFFALYDFDSGYDAQTASDQVLALTDSSIDPYCVASAAYCKGLALKREGKYDEALDWMKQARRRFDQQRVKGICFVIDLQLHWLYLQLPNYSFADAERVLEEASRFFSNSGDTLNKAYVLYLKARSLRFQGRYDEAASCFAQSVILYEEDAVDAHKPEYRIILRALQGQARARRLSALYDNISDQDRLAKRKEAAELLNRADAMADTMKAGLHDRAKIWLGQAYLALDEGRPIDARRQATQISTKTEKFQDDVMRSRVHLLRFKICCVLLAGARPDADTATIIRDAAKEADWSLKSAEDTSHRRVTARSLIAKESPKFSVLATQEFQRRDDIATKPAPYCARKIKTTCGGNRKTLLESLTEMPKTSCSSPSPSANSSSARSRNSTIGRSSPK